MVNRTGFVAFFLVVAIAGCAFVVIGDSAHAQSEPLAVQEEDIDADEIRLSLVVQSDGSAEWTVEFWMVLDDAETEEAFESLRTDIDDDPDAYTEAFETRTTETVRAASETTGREMAANEFSITTERQSLAREFGVVRYSYRWSGFAEVVDDELRAGDAIEGLFLDDDTRLLIGWPEEYELTDVSPEPDDQRADAVIWIGSETDFVSGEPRVVVTDRSSGLNTLVVAAGFGAVVLALGIVGLWLRTRSTETQPADAGDTVQESGQPDSLSPSESSEALLSNEEQVMRLLEANGGRMKQKRVVDELGWTDAKTSKVVSNLRDAGDIESFRIGRENVLTATESESENGEQ